MATKKLTTTKQAHPATLKNPRITEKAANLAGTSTYTFDVAVHVTKNEISKAFVAKYGKTPLKVNTVNLKPKSYFRRGVLSFGKRGKKAYVVLPKGVTIDIM